jgi:hypothetical protein
VFFFAVGGITVRVDDFVVVVVVVVVVVEPADDDVSPAVSLKNKKINCDAELIY